MSTGTAALKQLVLDQIAQVELYGDNIGLLCSWDNISTELLNLCIQREIVTDEDLKTAIHGRLLTLAQQAYDFHIKTNTEPDHLPSPEVLAYGIHHSLFSANTLRKITFDHGDTAETFMKDTVHFLVPQVLKKLREWKPPEPYKGPPLSDCC